MMKAKHGKWIVSLLVLISIGCGFAFIPAHVEREKERAAEALLRNFPAQPGKGELAILRRAYLSGSENWPAPTLLPDVENYQELAAFDRRKMQTPTTQTPNSTELQRLGQALFEDPLLSRSGQISCQSCHNRRLGWGDGLPTSFGHDRQTGRRNSPAIFNAAYRETLFWDGRAPDLGSQALFPLLDPVEMANHDVESIVRRVNESGKYRETFSSLFGQPDATISNIQDALVSFQSNLERTTKFDRFVQGQARSLNDEEIWGLHLFRTKAGCANCHHGALLSDERFHNIGLSYYGRSREDLGRYHITGEMQDVARFRTPSLRHVNQTGPFMHNGVMPSLEGIVNLYSIGGGRVAPDREKYHGDPFFKAATDKSSLLTTFKLTAEERAALVAFLKTL